MLAVLLGGLAAGVDLARAAAADAGAPPAGVTPAAGAVGAPPSSFTAETPWPLEPPCARPATISLAGGLTGELVWSTRDGAPAFTFTKADAGQTAPIDRERRVLRPVRLSGAGIPDSGPVLSIGCQRGEKVVWGPCPGRDCEVRVLYPAPLVPIARRLHRWTRPRPPRPDAPHDSRFLSRIARRAPDARGTRANATLLGRDLANDFLDALRVACPRDRCTPPLRAADRALTAFLISGGDRIASAVRATERTSAQSWRWTVAAGGTTLEAWCDDAADRPEAICTAALDVGDDLRLVYLPRGVPRADDRDIVLARRGDDTLKDARGSVRFERHDAARVWVELAGDALALR